ncbi:MAG TPA: TssQ family T6SS-associated lipoprotein [Burkholderiales bacterium]
MMRLLIVLTAVAALAGCGTEPMRELEALFNPNRGEAALAAGLKQYEDGRYAESLKNLQTAIGQGLNDGDRVNAHKHVAFIHCASNRERACRDEFRRALKVNPAMELAPAEAGHPIWGPIFRSVKAGR